MSYLPNIGQPYQAANRQVLERMQEFLEEHFPGGRVAGDEWVCASSDGGEGRSFSINMTTGRWAEFDPGASEDGERSAGGDVVGAIAFKLKIQPNEALGKTQRWLQGGTDYDPWSIQADHVYIYRLADEEEFGRVYRWDATDEHPKVIRPWDSKAGLRQAPKTDTRPLYNLPEIYKTLAPVVLVAGEKCAEAVTEVGMLATTIFGGESAIYKTDFEPLADRDVILWADNDKSGAAWQKRLVGILREADVSTVRVVKVSKGKPAKWDAADADPETRKALLDTAVGSRPIVQELPLLRMDTLTAGEPEPRQWIINGVLPQDVPALFYGPGGCGKSMAMLDLCVKVAARASHSGVQDPECFMGTIPEDAAGPAVFITLEDDTNEIHRRMLSLDPERKHEGTPLYVIPGLDIPDFQPALIAQQGMVGVLTHFAEVSMQKYIDRVTEAAGERPKLLVLDPAGDFVSGDDNSATVIEPLMFFLRRLAAENKMTISIVGHVSKGKQDSESVMFNQGRGSGSWAYRSRMAFGLWNPSHNASVAFLKAVGVENISPADIERVIFGRLTKGNFPKGTVGERKFLMDKDSGLLADLTKKAIDSKPSHSLISFAIIRAVETGVRLGMPFSPRSTGAGDRVSTGIFKRREHLPGILRPDTPHPIREKFLDDYLEKLISTGKIVVHNGYLDTPGGALVMGKTRAPNQSDHAAWKWPDNPYN